MPLLGKKFPGPIGTSIPRLSDTDGYNTCGLTIIASPLWPFYTAGKLLYIIGGTPCSTFSYGPVIERHLENILVLTDSSRLGLIVLYGINQVATTLANSKSFFSNITPLTVP